MHASLGSSLHLVKRFFGALSKREPAVEDTEWVSMLLSAPEMRIWNQMSAPDRRHAIQVARDVSLSLSDAPTSVLVAALLHDSGKIQSPFGTFGRVGATLFWAIVPDDRANRWLDISGIRGSLARYRRHPVLGSQQLAAAGSERLVIAWAAEHHLAPENWSIERAYGDVLKACDDD